MSELIALLVPSGGRSCGFTVELMKHGAVAFFCFCSRGKEAKVMSHLVQLEV